MTTELYEEEQTTTSDAPGSGFENLDTDTSSEFVCLGQFKRHKWSGGTVCERCGATKETPTPTAEGTGTRRTRTSARVGELETAISVMWAGLGFGIAKQPWVGQEKTDEDTRTVAEVVGMTVQMEAGIAGKRVERALRRTPAYKYIVQAITPIGIAADLGPLVMAPAMFGLAAWKPEVVRNSPGLQRVMLGMLVPILAEQAKMAEKQAELLSNFEGYNEETLAQASKILESILGEPKEDNGSS